MDENRKLSIKEWALEDRPREKLLAKGINSLTDAELIAILIGSGNKTESAVELGQRILKNAGNNLNELGKFTIDRLKENKGIGEAKAISIVAALELGRRRKAADILEKKQIKSSYEIFEIFRVLQDLPHEEFWILVLNRSNKILEKIKIGQGGISMITIDVRIILKHAIDKLASSIVLAHNHPSGSKEPSEADIALTNRLVEACKILDISVIDHIVIAGNTYYSFVDEGLLH